MRRLGTFNVKDLVPGLYPSMAAWDAKLDEVASRIRRAGVDVCALQEVGGQPALDGLTRRLGAGWQGFAAPTDERGIGCAWLAYGGRSEVRVHRCEALPFPTFYVEDPPPFGARLRLRRPVLELLTPCGARLFTVHLKSNLPRAARQADGTDVAPTTALARAEGHVRSLVQRAAEALYVRGLVDQALAESPRVAVCGDFNDGAGSLTLRLVRGVGGEPESWLSSVARAVPEHKRYTTLFRGRPQTLDHVLLSAALHAELEEADVDLDGLRDHGPYVPDAPPTIDSDHALLWAQLGSDSAHGL